MQSWLNEIRKVVDFIGRCLAAVHVTVCDADVCVKYKLQIKIDRRLGGNKMNFRSDF